MYIYYINEAERIFLMSKVHRYFIDNINKDYYKKGFEPSVNIYKFSDEYLKSLLLDDKALKDFQSKFGYSGNLNYADFHKIETKQKILEIEKEDNLKGVRGVFYVVILTVVLFLLSVKSFSASSKYNVGLTFIITLNIVLGVGLIYLSGL